MDNLNYPSRVYYHKFSKFSIIFFLFISVLLLFTDKIYAQQEKTITISVSNQDLQSIFNELEKTTIYRFTYKDLVLPTGKNITISSEKMDVDQFLSKLLYPINLSFKRNGNNFSIVAKPIEVASADTKNNNILITGSVKDVKEQPVIGAIISVAGITTIGTNTDVNGTFSLKVPPKSTLVISYLGYISQEISVTGKSNLNITLQEDSKLLDEVVVVGYGTQKKVNLTGAVSSIKGDEIVATKNENVQNMLTGRIPGVRVVQKSSEPGAFNNSFDIRGLGAPLIIIDGIPRSNMERLDPNEIESLSVLKDASASIYGVKATNGVVLITTKKGKEGKVELNYSFNYGLQQPIGLPKPVNAVDQMTLYNEYTMTKNPQNPYRDFTDADFAPYLNGIKQSSDWQKAALRETAPISQHNMSISGSSKILSYFFNFGYLKQDGFWKSGDLNYDRYNIRVNVDAKINNRLTAELKTSAIMDTKNQPYGDTWKVFKSLWRQSSTSPIYANNNPDYPGSAFDAAHTAVITDADKVGYSKYNNKWYQSSLALVYDIPFVTGLSAKALYSYDYNTASNKHYRKEYTLYTYDAQNKTYNPEIANSPSQIQREFFEKTQTMMQLSLNYKRSFGNHNASGLLLYEEGTQSGDNFFALRELSLPVDQLFAGNETNQQGNMSKSLNDIYDFATRAVVGRANYDFASRYLLEFSFRYDASSKFSKDNRWGFFPAVSGGWRISEESFLKNNELFSFVDNLKVRGSWGKMGDDALLEFQFLQGYNYPEGGNIFGGEYVNAIGFRGVPNKNLTWYEGETVNIGLDASFWNKKLGIELDLFQRDLSGLYDTRILTLPGTIGVGLPIENLNSKRNRGYELTLSHYNRIKDISYHVVGILSYTHSKWLHKESARALNAWGNWKNGLMDRNENIWWGYEDDGVFQSYDDIYNSSVYQDIYSLPGDYKYKDWNGDGVIDGNDEHPIAIKGVPILNFSLNLGADYKGFDFSALLQGTTKSYVEYADQLATPFPWGYGNILDIYQDRWHPVDPEADPWDPKTEWVKGDRPALGRPVGKGTAAIQNASYLRIKSIELGYSLPKSIVRKIGLVSARVYINGYNLATFTGLKYLDPEHPGDSSFGYLYPLTRSYNMGFNITF